MKFKDPNKKTRNILYIIAVSLFFLWVVLPTNLYPAMVIPIPTEKKVISQNSAGGERVSEPSVGQTFTTLPDQDNITAISVYFNTRKSTQNVSLSVYDSPLKNIMIGSVSISDVTIGYDVTNYYTKFNFNPSLTVSPSTQYYFEITCPAFNIFYSTLVYDGGKASWDSNQDIAFNIYSKISNPTPTPTSTPTPTPTTTSSPTPTPTSTVSSTPTPTITPTPTLTPTPTSIETSMPTSTSPPPSGIVSPSLPISTTEPTTSELSPLPAAPINSDKIILTGIILAAILIKFKLGKKKK